MDIKEALKEIRGKGLLSDLLKIEGLHNRARKLSNCLPETSSWDFESVRELFGLLQKDKDEDDDSELRRQVLRDRI